MKVIGTQAWRKGRAVMLLTFNEFPKGPDRYGMCREFIGADGVLRRSFAAWRTRDEARAEWRTMFRRYEGKGWTPVSTRCPRCGREWVDPWELREGTCDGCRNAAG